MIFDLKNQKDVTRLRNELNKLHENKKVVELKEYSEPRKLSRNSYAHLLIKVFALELGLTLKYAKENVFKQIVNEDIFVINIFENNENIIKLKSFKDLTDKDLKTAIDRFKNFCVSELNIYFEEFENDLGIEKMRNFVEQNKTWL